MRSNEERVAAVRQRVAQIKREKRQRRKRIAALSSVAACLVVIVAAALAIPGISKKLIAGDPTGYGTTAATASIFSSTTTGYIIIGLLAFMLGVCVTVFCFRLKAFSRKDGESEEGDGRDS